jgi:hypothetical protein
MSLEWRPANDSPNYLVSNSGIILSIASGRLTGAISSGGYLVYKIDRKVITGHRLVAKAFIPNPENKPQVNHINGIKTDNRVENLEWATSKENVTHSIKTGLRTNFTSNAKLDSVDIPIIREAYLNGLGTVKQLAKYFKVSKSTIRRIINNESWKMAA